MLQTENSKRVRAGTCGELFARECVQEEKKVLVEFGCSMVTMVSVDLKVRKRDPR